MTDALAHEIDDYDALCAIDWRFVEERRLAGIEGIHPYPAKFIGDIPRALISALPPRSGEAVFDPFCGSGSTLVEAQRAGFESVGVDLNPIACLISRVKTRPRPPALVAHSLEVIAQAKGSTSDDVPEIPNLSHWFHEDVQVALARLVAAISVSPSESRDALSLALSRIIVRVSRQESDTRYAAVDNDIRLDDVYKAFEASVELIDEALSGRQWELSHSTVIEADVLKLDADVLKATPVGLVITSPPYPNAYEYWLYHKYRMWWLGYDPIAVKEREIGARAHFFKKQRHTAQDFAVQMQTTMDLIDAVLVEGGHACVVVGRSKIHGELVDNAASVRSIAENMGYQTVLDASREINARRKSFNLSHANIRTESVLVFRKSSL